MELKSGGIHFTVHIGEDDTFPVIYGPALKDHNGQTLRCETESDAITIANQIQKLIIDSRT